MSLQASTLAAALGLCLTIAGAPQPARRRCRLSAKPPASRPIILAKRECIAYQTVNGKPVCVRWNDCKPGDKVC